MIWGKHLDMIYDFLGDDSADPVYFTEDQLHIYGNKMVQAINGRIKVLRKRAAVRVTAGTAECDLPNDVREIYRVLYDGQKITHTTQGQLNAMDETWRDVSGTPIYYYLDGLSNQIGLYPNPDTSSTVLEGDDDSGIPLWSGGLDGEGIVIDPRTNDHIDPVYRDDEIILSTITDAAVEVFYWADPDVLINDENPDLPSWASSFVMWGTLAEAFSVGNPDPDYSRALCFAAMAKDTAERIQFRANTALPKRYGGGKSKRGYDPRIRWPETIGDA